MEAVAQLFELPPLKTAMSQPTFTCPQHDFSYLGGLQIVLSEYSVTVQPNVRSTGTSRICVRSVKLIASDYLL